VLAQCVVCGRNPPRRECKTGTARQFGSGFYRDLTEWNADVVPFSRLHSRYFARESSKDGGLLVIRHCYHYADIARPNDASGELCNSINRYADGLHRDHRSELRESITSDVQSTRNQKRPLDVLFRQEQNRAHPAPLMRMMQLSTLRSEGSTRLLRGS